MKSIKEIKSSITSLSTVNILSNLWKGLTSKTLAYIVIGCLVFFAFKTCESKKDVIAEKTKIEQNLIAANDTVKQYKNKYNESVSEKTILIMTERELKKQNAELYNKVKQQGGSIITLNASILSLKQDTTLLRSKLRSIAGTPTQVNDSTWKLPFTLNYQWDKTNYDIYKGQTTVQVTGKTTLNKDGKIQKPIFDIKNIGSELVSRESNIDVTFGEKVIDNKYIVYIQSAYPGFTAKSLEGFMVDPNTNSKIKKLIKKQHWFTGWSLGLGVTPGFNILDGKFGVVIGPSLQWNIYNW